MIRRAFTSVVLGCSLFSTCLASTLVYTPVLPSFGGNPLNWSGFLAEADKQNIYHAPTPSTSTTASPLERFKEQLTYLILSRLAYKIVDAAFGESSLPEGTYNIEGYQITVTPTGSAIQVEIEDTTTGTSTVVEVPMYNNTSP